MQLMPRRTNGALGKFSQDTDWCYIIEVNSIIIIIIIPANHRYPLIHRKPIGWRILLYQFKGRILSLGTVEENPV